MTELIFDEIGNYRSLITIRISENGLLYFFFSFFFFFLLLSYGVSNYRPAKETFITNNRSGKDEARDFEENRNERSLPNSSVTKILRSDDASKLVTP